jgi:hypothetical protein
MAIAGSLIKGATKVVGKAINVAKKKKKKLEKKGKAVKEKGDINERVDIPFNRIKRTAQLERLDKIPDAVVGTVGAASQKANKAFKATKETVSKVAPDLDVGVKAGAIGLAGGVGTAMLASSLLKSNAKPEQEYTTKRLPDGRFSTTFGGNNANVVFASKQLSEKEINEVRTQLAVLDSIIDSTDPSKRRKEFIETAELLARKYGISNVSGKNLSLMMPTAAGNNRVLNR